MLFFDIETDGLLDEVTKLHCIVIYDPQKDRYLRFDPISNPIQEGLKLLSEADLIIGHNIIGYDLPAIKKLHPWFSHGRVLDTMIWARLIAPDIEDYDYPRWKAGTLPGGLIGSHSLKAWGYRLGVLKGAFAETTDWQEWSVQMTDYCQQDVLVTRALHDKLKTKYVSQEALELEHKVAEIIQRQHQHGVLFDLDKAEKLYLELRKKREELRKELANVFEPWFEPVKKNEVFVPKTNNARMGYIKGAACCKIKLVKFNPASNKHIAYNFIKKYGWEPTEFTEKSKEPQINEDILKALPYPEAPKLAEFWTLNKRCSQIAEGDQAWLKTYNPNTGRIHGSINTIGAVTRRMTHFKPNTAQVPASYSLYGKECRSCFIVPRGYKMVGCDAEGLEARALGHFLALYDSGEYAKAVVEGKKEEGTDVHTVNWRALGKICKDRDTAKTFFYAWMYGAGDAKLARILGCSVPQAKKAKKDFLNNLPAMKKLKAAIEKTVKERGFLRSLDGQPLKVRSMHSALNTLLQSAGAIVMKKALVLLDETLQVRGLVPGLHYEFILNVHDEYSLEVMDVEGLPELVAKEATKAITRAGEHFNFRCPLTGEAKIGKTWLDVH